MPTKTPIKPAGLDPDVPMFPDDAPAFREIEVGEIGGTSIEDITLTPTTQLVPMVIPEPPTHHLVVGMATLASMSEEEFRAKLAVMKSGQERIKIIQEELLTKGEDYGVVKGIDRPFLHQPGAEKLANFYGFAVRQEAERIPGRRTTIKVGNEEFEGGEWQTPPLAYHVKSYVHLGDFTGPIIAMGYGEASSWEEKHRYRWAKAVCPKCGREGLIKGKADGKLKGKWWCPGKEGGCNSTFEAADPAVSPPAKIENNDPYSLAETLIQMAGKRSFVAAIRRATGTSGLFTQDEDSPSVREQVKDIEQGDPEPVVTAGPDVNVGVGAKTEAPSMEQLRRLVSLSKEKDIDKAALSALFKRLFDVDVEETSPAISRAAKALTAEQLGKLLWTMETGEVDPTLPATTTSGSPTRATTPPDTSTGDDIGGYA